MLWEFSQRKIQESLISSHQKEMTGVFHHQFPNQPKISFGQTSAHAIADAEILGFKFSFLFTALTSSQNESLLLIGQQKEAPSLFAASALLVIHENLA